MLDWRRYCVVDKLEVAIRTVDISTVGEVDVMLSCTTGDDVDPRSMDELIVEETSASNDEETLAFGLAVDGIGATLSTSEAVDEVDAIPREIEELGFSVVASEEDNTKLLVGSAIDKVEDKPNSGNEEEVDLGTIVELTICVSIAVVDTAALPSGVVLESIDAVLIPCSDEDAATGFVGELAVGFGTPAEDSEILLIVSAVENGKDALEL